VIPEIEMPGHAQTAAISAYPHLRCTGKSIKVAQKWGVFERFFAQNPKPLSFLFDV
jgi:hexosaminidase